MTCCEIFQTESVKDILEEIRTKGNRKHYNKIFNRDGIQIFEPALLEIEINNQTNILEVIKFFKFKSKAFFNIVPF